MVGVRLVSQWRLGAIIINFVVPRFVLLNKLGAGKKGIVRIDIGCLEIGIKAIKISGLCHSLFSLCSCIIEAMLQENPLPQNISPCRQKYFEEFKVGRTLMIFFLRRDAALANICT